MIRYSKFCARCGRWRIGRRCATCKRRRRKANRKARAQQEQNR